MSEYDTSYNNESCYISDNIRLSNNQQYIALLSVSCISTEIDNLDNSMKSDGAQFSGFRGN